MNRRQLLAGSAALALAPRISLAAAPAIELKPAPTSVQLAPGDYPKTEVWSYNDQIPGQTLRFKQGDRLNARLINGLKQDTTIHWHGLRVPNNMDGVPDFSQAPVRPGDTFNYTFDLPDAGTYWYHPHFGTLEQISRGMSGPLIIEEAESPDIDAEHVLVLDDWRLTEKAQIHDSFGSGMDLSHAGRIGNFVTANGQDVLTLPADSGQRLRLRLINTATARIFDLGLRGLEGWVIALDGMPLETPQKVDRITLATAQRADVIVDVTAEPNENAYLISIENGESYAVTTFEVSKKPAQAHRDAPMALPPNTVPALNLENVTTTPMLMQGGAMRGMGSAIYEGTKLGMRELMQKGQFWSLNGMAGLQEAPLVTASVGQTVRIPMQNDTVFPHAIHLHGHHFREIGPDGGQGPLRDTILVLPGETREIAFVADNPGDWVFHCHMISHQMAGMTTWVKVVGG